MFTSLPLYDCFLRPKKSKLKKNKQFFISCEDSRTNSHDPFGAVTDSLRVSTASTSSPEDTPSRTSVQVPSRESHHVDTTLRRKSLFRSIRSIFFIPQTTRPTITSFEPFLDPNRPKTSSNRHRKRRDSKIDRRSRTSLFGNLQAFSSGECEGREGRRQV